MLSVFRLCWASAAICWPCVVFADMESGVPQLVLAMICGPAMLTIVGVLACSGTEAMDTAFIICERERERAESKEYIERSDSC